MNALFIGRFQPFHKGHLKVIKYALEKYDEIIIGIGSSQYQNTIKNPFSFKERKNMIKKTLNKNNIKDFRIIPIPDIHNPPKWVDHVLSITKNFDVVITNSTFTKKLFEEKAFKVVDTPIFNKDNYSGKEIRNRIKNNENWEKCVPETVEDLIKKIDGVKRIKNISD